MSIDRHVMLARILTLTCGLEAAHFWCAVGSPDVMASDQRLTPVDGCFVSTCILLLAGILCCVSAAPLDAVHLETQWSLDNRDNFRPSITQYFPLKSVFMLMLLPLLLFFNVSFGISTFSSFILALSGYFFVFPIPRSFRSVIRVPG